MRQSRRHCFNSNPPTTLVASADYDFFVAKFDPDGRCLWARSAQGATGLPAGLAVEGGLTVAVDSQGSCYVGGGFVKRLVFKDASNNTVATLTDAGPQLSYEAFAAKYDASGQLLWARGGQSNCPQDARDLSVGLNGISDLALDSAGNPYLAGCLSGNNFLGTPVSIKGKTDALVARLNPQTGAPVWVSLIGSAAFDMAVGLGIDNAAHIHVVGSIGGETTFPTVPPQTGGIPIMFPAIPSLSNSSRTGTAFGLGRLSPATVVRSSAPISQSRAPGRNIPSANSTTIFSASVK